MISFKKIFLFIISILPIPFICLYMDAIYKTVTGYFIFIAVSIFIAYKCKKDDNIKYTIIATLISMLISYKLSSIYLGTKWNFYFKPSEAKNYAIIMSIVSMALQIIIYKKTSCNKHRKNIF